MAILMHWGAALWRNKVLRMCLAVALGACAGIAAGHSFKASVSIVDGSSMVPTYQPGDRVFTTAVTRGLDRGDIVLVDDGHTEYALKRIVGMPGETVKLWRGFVFIDGRMLAEPYLPKYTYTFADEKVGISRFVLGPDDYFLLGDNRLCSVDSRFYGPINRNHIRGCAPLPENQVRAHLLSYTLPWRGKRAIRPLEPAAEFSSATGPLAFEPALGSAHP